MIRRISIRYLKRYLPIFLIVFTGLIGTISAIASLYFSFSIIFIIVALSIFISSLYIFVKYPPDYSLPKDLVVIDLDNKITTKIHFPCDDKFF